MRAAGAEPRPPPPDRSHRHPEVMPAAASELPRGSAASLSNLDGQFRRENQIPCDPGAKTKFGSDASVCRAAAQFLVSCTTVNFG